MRDEYWEVGGEASLNGGEASLYGARLRVKGLPNGAARCKAFEIRFLSR